MEEVSGGGGVRRDAKVSSNLDLWLVHATCDATLVCAIIIIDGCIILVLLLEKGDLLEFNLLVSLVILDRKYCLMSVFRRS